MPPFSEEERETCVGGGVIDVDERERARRPADPASPSQLPASKSDHEVALAAGAGPSAAEVTAAFLLVELDEAVAAAFVATVA